MSSSPALWYLTRSSGLVALMLLTATTLIGVLTAMRWRNRRWPRFAVAGLHRNLTLLALAFIGTHVVTTVADTYTPIGVRDVLVPFLSSYRPVWVGLGALALDLLLAITITSLLRKHIGYRTWRALHWAAYATWPLALAHGLGSGSDARFGWMAALSFASLGLVAGAVGIRLLHDGRPRLQLAAGTAVVAVALLLVVWYRGGPAQHGWAARAGTPSSLLKSTRGTSAASSLAAVTSRPVRPLQSFAGRLSGRLSLSGPDAAGDAAIAIALAVRGETPGLIRLTLWGTALQGGGLEMSQSRVSFVDAASGVVYTGHIVTLDGTRVVADVSSSSGATMRLDVTLRIDSRNNTVTGVISGRRIGRDDAD